MEGIFQIDWGWDFVVRFLTITLIDLALSGDNALVIGMAAASLPRKDRKRAIIFGAGCAIVLRIILTTIASLLMRVPLISAIGGVVLFWVTWRLLKVDTHDTESHDKANVKRNFRQAIFLIITADFMMSLDNVIAVAGSAGSGSGSEILLIAGLLLSMPLLMVTGGAISMLIDKLRWLPYLGAAVISFTGTRMIFDDRFIEPRLQLPTTIVIITSIIVGIGITALFTWLNHRKQKKDLAAQKTEETAVDKLPR